MQEFHLKIGANGELILPLPLRELLSAQPGDELVILGETHNLRLYRSPDMARRMAALRTLQEMASEIVPPDVSLADELIAGRRAEAAREAEEYPRSPRD